MIKNCNLGTYLSLGLYKGRPSNRRSLQPSKKNIQHFNTWKFFTFIYFLGSFFPLHRPDPDSWSGSTDLIESGSETLLESQLVADLWGSGASVRLCYHTKFEFLHFSLSFLKFISIFILNMVVKWMFHAEKNLDPDQNGFRSAVLESLVLIN